MAGCLRFARHSLRVVAGDALCVEQSGFAPLSPWAYSIFSVHPLWFTSAISDLFCKLADRLQNRRHRNTLQIGLLAPQLPALRVVYRRQHPVLDEEMQSMTNQLTSRCEPDACGCAAGDTIAPEARRTICQEQLLASSCLRIVRGQHQNPRFKEQLNA